MNPKRPRSGEILDRLVDDELATRDDHVRDVAELGYDLASIERRLSAKIDEHVAAAKRARMDAARDERLRASSRASQTLDRVRQLRLPEPELRRRVMERQPAMAHRELENWTREGLESALADLLDLEGDDSSDSSG